MQARTHTKVHAALSFALLNERNLDAVCKEETKRSRERYRKRAGDSVKSTAFQN